VDGTVMRPDPLDPPTTRVIVVDDQRLVRAGFRVILDAEPDITVVAEAADGLAAIDVVRQHAPDVVLMDIQMPRMDGLQATRELLASSASKIVILTTFGADEYVYEALRLGASGFLLKDAPPEQLISAVHCAVRGDALIDPSLTKRLIDAFIAQQPAQQKISPELEQLTPREREVLVLLARGLSNAEIANHLVVEETTAKTHVARVLMKLGVRDRVQAVIRAYETRLVTPG
jgi:DNA-binding NarL/FixJ family response regulator